MNEQPMRLLFTLDSTAFEVLARHYEPGEADEECVDVEAGVELIRVEQGTALITVNEKHRYVVQAGELVWVPGGATRRIANYYQRDQCLKLSIIVVVHA